MRDARDADISQRLPQASADKLAAHQLIKPPAWFTLPRADFAKCAAAPVVYFVFSLDKRWHGTSHRQKRQSEKFS